MHAIKIEIRKRNCDSSDKLINIKSKAKHITSKTHKHKKGIWYCCLRT